MKPGEIQPISVDQPATSIAGRSVLAVVSVAVACISLRVWLIGHTDVIARDGITYIKMARELANGPGNVIKGYDYHVGYPVAMAGAHWLLRSAGLADGVSTWELSGQIVSLVASLAALAAVWAFAGMTFNWRVAWVSALLFGLGKKWAALGADVLSDALAVCLQMWAVVIALIVLKQLERKNWWAIVAAAGVGLCGGLGYLVRPEALLPVGLACILWLAAQFRRPAGWRLTLASVATAVVVTLACSLPYMIAIGGLTGKKSLGDFVVAPKCDESVAVTASMISAGEFIAPRQLINQLFEAMHPAAATLACIWLGCWVMRRLKPIKRLGLSPYSPHPAGAFMMSAVLIVMSSLLMAMYLHVHYLDYRHVMFPAALLSALAGAGAVALAGLGKNLSDRIGLRWPRQLFLVVFVTLIAATMVVYSLEPLHAGKAYFHHAGWYLAASIGGKEDYLLTDNPWVLYYSRARGEVISERDGETSDDWVKRILRSPATHLAISDRNTRKAMGQLPLGLAADKFDVIGEFQQQRSKRPDIVRVYRIRR